MFDSWCQALASMNLVSYDSTQKLEKKSNLFNMIYVGCCLNRGSRFSENSNELIVSESSKVIYCVQTFLFLFSSVNRMLFLGSRNHTCTLPDARMFIVRQGQSFLR